MAKTKQEKKAIVKEIRKNLGRQTATFFVNFEGLGADRLFELREKIKKKKGLFYVAKKKLMEIAFEKEAVPFEEERLPGPTGLVFSFEDEVPPVKAVYGFEKEYQTPKILAGVVEGELVSRKRAVELARLPSSRELKRKLVGILRGPVSGLENTMGGNIKGLLISLNKI